MSFNAGYSSFFNALSLSLLGNRGYNAQPQNTYRSPVLNPYSYSSSTSYLNNTYNIFAPIINQPATNSGYGQNAMSMLLMMLLGQGNNQQFLNPSILEDRRPRFRAQDNDVALLSRGAAGQSWGEALAGNKLDDQNLSNINAFFGNNLSKITDQSNGGFQVELLDRRGNERKAIAFDQFKTNAQYFDTEASSWKALSNLDVAKNATTADQFWTQLKEKSPTLNLRYVDAESNKVLNIGTRWNNSIERQDSALLTRGVAGASWKTELDTRGGVYAATAQRIKDFFGSNYANLTDTSNGNMTLELFDQTAKEVKTYNYADFVKTAEYYEDSSKTWKPLAEKASTALALTALMRATPVNVRYIDPTTREVKVIGDRVYGHGSPVVLDTDGSGKIELTSLQDGVQFDLDGDGKKEQISWTQAKGDKTDAWLALDRNGNGQIDSGKELFGNQHGLANGYEELKKFDDNHDGVINEKDAVYSQLKTWKDVNHDGISQASEMQDLKTAGVASVKIGYTNSTEKDRFGNELRQQSAFTRTDDAAAKLAQTLGGSAAAFKSGLSVDAWVNTLRSA